MKRSEMIQILDDLIFSYTENDYDGPHYDYDEILRGLEKAGMLPPPHNCDIMTGKPDKYGSVLKYDWELEEE